MVRTQIQLTEEQSKTLKTLAAQRGISMAELIRQGIDSYLRSCIATSQEERRQRAIKAAGQFHSGQTDLSEEHDTYLAEDKASPVFLNNTTKIPPQRLQA